MTVDSTRSVQADLFAAARAALPSDAHARALVEIVELLDRDAPWTLEHTKDPEQRVYYVLCALLSRMDIGNFMAKLVPLRLRIRKLLRSLDTDEARGFVAEIDTLMPGIDDDKDGDE